MKSYSKLLVPTDFSPHSDKALDVAMRLATVFGSEIHMLLAFGHPTPPSPPGEVLIPNDFWGTDRDGALRRLQECFAPVSEAALAGDIYLIDGHPEEAILAMAERLPADMIVMGTRGRMGFAHLLVDSVAERIIRLAPCPVMTVRAPAEDDAWESLQLEQR